MRTFEQIFRREGVKAAFVEGDSFHRYDRAEMKQRMAEALEHGRHDFSHFGPEANLFEELAGLFATTAATGGGRRRKYLHDDEEAAAFRAGARHLHAVGGRADRTRTCCSTRGCTARWSPTRSTSRGTSTC